MTSRQVGELAKQFILAYLSYIRHKSSLISKEDWGLFPFYWYKSSKVTISVTLSKDLAISIDRTVGGREDRISIKKAHGRIEETHFPHLNYASWPMFHVPKNAHHIIITGGTYNVQTHPFIVVSNGAEVRLLKIRVEASVRGYPRERIFLWILTSPNEKYLSEERAESEAEHDFWGHLQSLVIDELDYLLSQGVEDRTLILLKSSIERLREGYHRLISREDLDEQMLQNFLEDHYFLLTLGRKAEKMKRKLGSYIPDFILRHEDGTFTLVEVQLNRDPIIQNNGPSSGMKEAIQQLIDWFGWIDSNEHSNLTRYSGLIVIGRKERYLNNETKIKEIISGIKYPVRLLTYDDLDDSIGYVLSQLRRARRQK